MLSDMNDNLQASKSRLSLFRYLQKKASLLCAAIRVKHMENNSGFCLVKSLALILSG